MTRSHNQLSDDPTASVKFRIITLKAFYKNKIQDKAWGRIHTIPNNDNEVEEIINQMTFRLMEREPSPIRQFVDYRNKDKCYVVCLNINKIDETCPNKALAIIHKMKYIKKKIDFGEYYVFSPSDYV